MISGAKTQGTAKAEKIKPVREGSTCRRSSSIGRTGTTTVVAIELIEAVEIIARKSQQFIFNLS